MFRPYNTVSDTKQGWELRVYCMGIKDIQKLVAMMSRSTALLQAFQSIRTTLDSKNDKTSDREALAKSLGSALIPFINDNAYDILVDTVKFVTPIDATIDDLPHWAIPTIIDQWIDINFKEPRQWLPWIEMMENLLKKMPTQKTTESDSSIPSNS